MQNIGIQENKQDCEKALWVFMCTTALEIPSLHKDIHIQIFSATAIAIS